jgi:hypothetical protein
LSWSEFTPSGASGLTLWKGVLGEAAMSTLYGVPGSGKSFLALHLSVCVALGAPCLGRKTTRGPVVYLVGEGAAGLRQRREAIARTLPGECPKVAFYPAALNTPRDVETLLDVVAEAERIFGAPPSLVIVDTVNRFFGDGDENSARDMKRYLDAFAALVRRYPRVHVLHVHHAGKDPSRGMRGSSASNAAMDTVIECRKLGEGRHLAIVEKQKDGEEGVRFAFRLKPVQIGTDEDGNPVSSCVVEPEGEPSAAAPAAHGVFVTGHEKTAVDLLQRLAREGGLMRLEVPYAEYLERWYALDPNAIKDTVQKSARRSLENLEKRRIVTYDKTSKTIHLNADLFAAHGATR